MIFEAAVKFMKTAKFIVLENFMLYSSYVLNYKHILIATYIGTYLAS